MDWSWLNQALVWIVAVNNTISNFAAVLGFLTLLVAGVAYVVRRMFQDPFGSKLPKGPRYRKFFETFIRDIGKHNRSLSGPDDASPAPSCTFRTDKATGQGVTYCVHFLGDGNFGVYLNLKGRSAPAMFERLGFRKEELRQSLTLYRRVGFRKREAEKFEWERVGQLGYRIIVYYQGGGVIGADAKQLKQMLKWAERRLIAFQRVFDVVVPEVQREAKLEPEPIPAEEEAVAAGY